MLYSNDASVLAHNNTLVSSRSHTQMHANHDGNNRKPPTQQLPSVAEAKNNNCFIFKLKAK